MTAVLPPLSTTTGPANPESAPGLASPPAEPIADGALLSIEIQLEEKREVPARFDGVGTETAQRFSIVVASEPPQRLLIGELRQTMCHVAKPEGAVAGMHCYTNAVGFDLHLVRTTGGILEVRADEGLESGISLARWTVGYLRVPDDQPFRVAIVESTPRYVVDEVTFAPR